MNSDNKHLYHGSDWAEQEDVLIGNKEGLEALRFAIDVFYKDMQCAKQSWRTDQEV